MDIRTLIFAGDAEAKPILYACGKCGQAVSPRFYGGGKLGHDTAIERAEQCCTPAPPEVDQFCGCGVKLQGKWQKSCETCRVAAIVAVAEVITQVPDVLCIVGTDRYFSCAADAADEFPGAWAHPCEVIPLSVNPKQMAESLCETTIENMCEEAFEDAADQVNGTRALQDAFEAALVIFNDAQTSSSWMEDPSKVYLLPDAPVEKVEAA